MVMMMTVPVFISWPVFLLDKTDDRSGETFVLLPACVSSPPLHNELDKKKSYLKCGKEDEIFICLPKNRFGDKRKRKVFYSFPGPTSFGTYRTMFTIDSFNKVWRGPSDFQIFSGIHTVRYF